MNIKYIIEHFSFQKRKERKYKKMLNELEFLENLCEDELTMEYIDKKIEYKGLKRRLLIYYILFFISIFPNCIEKFYLNFRMILFLFYDVKESIEAEKTTIILFSITLFFFIMIFYFSILSLIGKINKVYYSLQLIKSLRNRTI